MNFNNYTIKSQEAIQSASDISKENRQQAIEDGHLFKALLSQEESVIPFLLKKAGANVDFLNVKNEYK